VPKLPRISGRECVRALEKLGFVQVQQRGSHVIMRESDRGCSVPMHKSIKTGTLRGLLNQAKVEIDEFLEALRG
jgi:predicted RNA binding protein YcfA (HicA-like mRNA interferase family)